MKTNLAIVLALLLAPLAAASTLAFNGPSYQSGCQCDPQQFLLSLANDASQGEVFTLSIETDSDTFTTFVTPTVESQPHSQNPVIAFMTPHCDALPGNYSFTVRATGSRGATLHASGVSHVEQCHYLLLHFTPEQQACAGEQARFDVTLENAGYFPEAGSLYTDLDPQLYSLANSSFSLAPGASKQFNLYVNTPNSMPPSRIPFSVNASSLYTYRESFAILDVLDCSSLKIWVPPACITVDAGEEVTEHFTLTNTGIGDTFDVTLLCPAFVTTTQDSVTLASGQSVTLPMTIKPSKSDLNKDYPCTVRAVSRRYGREFTNSTAICVRKLYSADLRTDLSGNSLSVCQGDSATLPFHIRNTGKSATYALSTSLGALSKNSVTLAAGGEDSFTVNVPDTLAVGDYNVRVTAENQFHTENEYVKLTVEKCYDSALGLSQGSLEICPGETLSATATLQNKGTRADDFAISLASPDYLHASAEPFQLSINALSSKSFRVTVSALYNAQDNAAGAVQITATDGSTSASALAVRILPNGVCHNIAITPDSLKEVEVCQGNTFDLLVTNRGRFAELLDLSVEGPNWAFVTPPKLSVAPGESKHAYVFFSPPFSTAPGDYPMVFHASNERVSAQVSLTARVYPVGGLGHQIPNYTTTDYVLDFEIPTAVEFEEGASRQLAFKVTNRGIAPLNDIMLFFENDDLRVLNESVAPFGLAPGQQRMVVIEAAPVRGEGSYATMFRAVAKEKFVERSSTITVKPRSVLVSKVSQEYYREGNSSLTRVTLSVANNGSVTLNLSPSLLGAGNYSFEEMPAIAAGESKLVRFSTVAPTESNSTVTLVLQSGDARYFDQLVLQPEPLGATGLFASATTLGALLLALAAAAAIIYVVTRRRKAVERQTVKRSTRKKKR